MEHLVLTIIAEDQPGLVERLSKRIAEHGGNWLESRMARMAGQFAGILRVAVASEQREALIEALQGLASQGIRVQSASTPADAGRSQGRAIGLSLVGNDRPGIVRDITRLLAEYRVNVENLATEVVPAPMSGELLFQASARLAVPDGLALEDLQARLEALADDLMVELKLQPED